MFRKTRGYPKKKIEKTNILPTIDVICEKDFLIERLVFKGIYFTQRIV